MSTNFKDIENRPLSNFDIINICKKLKINLTNVVMKDELHDDDMAIGNTYIMNLQSSYEPGTHWTAIIVYSDSVLYFDSFGVICPENEYQLFKHHFPFIFYNTTDIQNINSVLCGWYCIALLAYLHYNRNKNTIPHLASEFLKLFSKDNSKNDKILRTFFRKLALKLKIH